MSPDRRRHRGAHPEDAPLFEAAQFSPDRDILNSADIAVTSDSNVLDGARAWLTFNAYFISQDMPRTWLIDLRAG